LAVILDDHGINKSTPIANSNIKTLIAPRVGRMGCEGEGVIFTWKMLFTLYVLGLKRFL